MSIWIYWRSSHYTVTHMLNENSVHIQGRSPDVVSDFPYHKKLLFEERIYSLWEQDNFERGITACSSSLPLMCVLATPLEYMQQTTFSEQKILAG